MRLPNGEQAVVEEAKLLDYCLSTTHPRGKHKARVFAAAFGLTANDMPLLRDALLEAARVGVATATRADEYGQRYEIRFPFAGPKGTGEIVSAWIIASGQNIPRLVTCFPV